MVCMQKAQVAEAYCPALALLYFFISTLSGSTPGDDKILSYQYNLP